MAGPTKYRRILKSWHDHKDGIWLYITRHNEDAGPVYRLEDLTGRQWAWRHEDKAREVAHRLLGEIGHKCTAKCRYWSPVSS